MADHSPSGSGGFFHLIRTANDTLANKVSPIVPVGVHWRVFQGRTLDFL